MITGTGIDLVEIERVRKILERRGDKFVEKVFTDREKEYCEKQKEPAPHYAARFAAKESCLKALGLGMGAVSWKELEVVTTSSGQPELCLSGRAREILREKGVGRLLLSLSHSSREAIAIVIAERDQK
ncbi:MAG: holo-ACP synthase [Syntrophales bacterium]|nr:holo-ACP synthase [Syntrophales bacterium]